MRMHLSCLQTALCDTSFMNVAKGSGWVYLYACLGTIIGAILVASPFAASAETRIAEQTRNDIAVYQGAFGFNNYPAQSFIASSTGDVASFAAASDGCGISVNDGHYSYSSFIPVAAIPGGYRYAGSPFHVEAGNRYYLTSGCNNNVGNYGGSILDTYAGGEAGHMRLPGIFDTKFASNASTGNLPLDWAFAVCMTDDCSLTPPPPPPCTQDCNDNVLFIPGIESNRLYDTDNGETRLWEPGSDADLQQLALDSSGSSVRQDIYAKDGDVLDEAYAPVGPNIYNSFIAKLNELKQQGKIADWHAAAYDWRLSMDQILSSGSQSGDHISYLVATGTPYIEQELRALAATSRTGKVTIVAHSNGGLVAKALMVRLGDAETARLIDRVILVASPQVGTPSAITGLLHGYQSGIMFKTSDAATRQLGDNSPTAYNLLPSASYFTYVDDPVITFSTTTLPDWVGRYGEVIHSGERQHAMLTDSYGRVNAASSDIMHPTQLSDALLSQAEALHTALDSWAPPSGVRVIQIAGWGIPTTIKGVDYASTSKPEWCSSCESGFALAASTTIDGDGTVVVPSALWMSTSTPGIENYWVDLNDYNHAHPIQTGFGFFPTDHKSILEVPSLIAILSDQITNNMNPLSNYAYISDYGPASNDTRLRYTLHSPLTLDLYDDQGRHTGISTTTGQLEEQIPGTYYDELAGVKYLYTDASSSMRIILSGYDTGTFTFDVDELQGDDQINSAEFKDIPVTPNTKAVFDIQSDITTLSPMHLDENGTGSVIDIAPKLGGIVTFDTTPPSTALNLAGTSGLNGWYTSDVTVTLTATDTQSAISSVAYSLDGAPTTSVATSSVSFAVSAEGVHVLRYFSADASGNQELPTTTTIKLDKTAPEASIGFSTSTRSVAVSTPDASSTFLSNATSTLVMDQAGNSLALGTKVSSQARSTAFTMYSLKYSTGTTSNATTTLRYFWTTDKTGKYTLLISAIRTPADRVLAIYTSLTNRTYLLTTTSADDVGDLSLHSAILLLRPKIKMLKGMQVPFVTTFLGSININI